jgi:hypothetical protein
MFSTPQTKILGVVSLLAVLVGAAFYAIQGNIERMGVFALFAVIPFLINIYTVHCVIFGKCTIYSWLLTLLLTLSAAAIFMTYGQLILRRHRAATRAAVEQSESASMLRMAEEALGIPEF